MIEIKEGNIFEANVQALVNPVNCVGVMGKGLALEFKKIFKFNFKHYELYCNRGLLEPGKIFVTEEVYNEELVYIINFPTKNHWREKSELIDIENGLKTLVNFIKEKEIESIAIPALGAGLGGLEWKEVLSKIHEIMGGLDDVDIHIYAPKKE